MAAAMMCECVIVRVRARARRRPQRLGQPSEAAKETAAQRSEREWGNASPRGRGGRQEGHAPSKVLSLSEGERGVQRVCLAGRTLLGGRGTPFTFEADKWENAREGHVATAAAAWGDGGRGFAAADVRALEAAVHVPHRHEERPHLPRPPRPSRMRRARGCGAAAVRAGEERTEPSASSISLWARVRFTPPALPPTPPLPRTAPIRQSMCAAARSAHPPPPRAAYPPVHRPYSYMMRALPAIDGSSGRSGLGEAACGIGDPRG